MRGNILLIILVTVGIMAVSVGGYFWWSNQQILKNTPLSWEECIKIPKAQILFTYPGQCTAPDSRKVTQPLTDEEKKKLVPPDETVNWKTFVHPTLNYSFSYPEILEVKTYGSRVLIRIDPPDPRLIVSICPRSLVFSAVDTKSKSTSTKNEYLCINSSSIIENRIFVETQYREGDKRVIDQILSTFKFL